MNIIRKTYHNGGRGYVSCLEGYRPGRILCRLWLQYVSSFPTIAVYLLRIAEVDWNLWLPEPSDNFQWREHHRQGLTGIWGRESVLPKKRIRGLGRNFIWKESVIIIPYVHWPYGAGEWIRLSRSKRLKTPTVFASNCSAFCTSPAGEEDSIMLIKTLCWSLENRWLCSTSTVRCHTGLDPLMRIYCTSQCSTERWPIYRKSSNQLLQSDPVGCDSINFCLWSLSMS